jgi:hypothetical protein
MAELPAPLVPPEDHTEATVTYRAMRAVPGR